MPNTSQNITAIVAATLNNGIGLNGGLPWRLPGEMKYFARVTTGEASSSSSGTNASPNTVIMGRKTWESIPPKFRPLKDRRNLVISRQGVQLAGEALTSTYDSLPSALATLDSASRTFLIGGSQLYTQALSSNPPLVDRVLLTRILTPFDCDAFLYDFRAETGRWQQSSHEELREWVGWDVPAGEIEEKGVRYRYEMWVRQ